MTFNPKFTSYRSRLATFAIMAGFYGTMVLLFGHNPCHRGWDAVVIAGILLIGCAIPESPGPKAKAETYTLTGP